jgi:hypothetical protein
MTEILMPSVVFQGEKTILDLAEEATNGRLGDYGHPLDMYSYCAKLWSCFLNQAFPQHQPIILSPEEVARMMILFKEARNFNGVKQDNLVDTAGYARVIEMMREEGERRNGVQR